MSDTFSEELKVYLKTEKEAIYVNGKESLISLVKIIEKPSLPIIKNKL